MDSNVTAQKSAKIKFTREEKSWMMYDWANSSFATIMLAAVFPVFFVGIAGGYDTPGSMWWGYGASGSRILLAIAAPIIGVIIDFKGFKKRLFITFMSIGILALFFLATQSSWQLLLLGYVIANIFWSACNFIYDSYLPDITTPDRMDQVSATGFAWGYIGGSTIPFVISIGLILFQDQLGIDMFTAVRISIILTAVWWGLFSIPMIRDVHHKHGVAAPESHAVRTTFRNIARTAKKITKNRGLFLFIVAYFFYIDGVGTVITMATAYGAELGLGEVGMIGALFLTQIVAFPCSIIFGKLSKKYNPLNLIFAAILIYIGICIIGFIMGFGLETYWFTVGGATVLFWILAFLVGTVQGGIQAISRSCFGRLVPAENSGEYFGFFEIFSRFSAILGPFLYATILRATGRASFSILSTVLLFIVGFIILLASRKDLKAQLAHQQATP
ncbi:MAG: MFS transporter [Oscillospiraceae bacterium]|nr:MFS transporter [Oscillospiraceae bacterium]